jgi:hypothetical protein
MVLHAHMDTDMHTIQQRAYHICTVHTHFLAGASYVIHTIMYLFVRVCMGMYLVFIEVVSSVYVPYIHIQKYAFWGVHIHTYVHVVCVCILPPRTRNTSMQFAIHIHMHMQVHSWSLLPHSLCHMVFLVF